MVDISPKWFANETDKAKSRPLVIANPLESATAAVPVEIKVETDMLLWRRDEENVKYPMEGFIEGTRVDGALLQFIELYEADAERICAFARKYGVLGIRSDGLPATATARGAVNLLPPVRVDGEMRWYEEPIGAWRMYALGLRAILGFAMEARDGSSMALDSVIREYDLGRHTWESFNLPTGDDDGISGSFRAWGTFLDPAKILYNLARVGPQHTRTWLSNFITWSWIEYANLRPVMTWEGGEARMTLSLGQQYPHTILPQNTLFSVLAAQLAALVTSEGFERMAQCNYCGRLFIPKKRPGRHEHAYCDEHKIEAERARKRRSYRRQADKRRRDEQAEG